MPSDTVIHDYIAGAVGGAAGLIVGHPFDTTKVQLQTQHHGHQYKGTFDAIKNINKFGLIKGFYRGLSWPLFSFGIVNSTFFGVYGHTLTYLEKDKTKRKSNLLHIYLSGCVGGAAQLVFVVPVDYIKTALQSQIPHDMSSAAKEAGQRFFKGPWECSKAIYRERGIFGFYKGGLAMAYREIPSYGIYCLTYEILSAKMHEHGLTDSNGIVASLVSGGIAGSLTWASIIPFDVIKSRFQADFSGEYRGFMHCARMLYKEGGIRIFYTGCLVTCLRAFPVNAVTFTVYTQTLKHLENNF
ncbi:solute carrier family 25 member 45-like [Mercenaria mercenaria]|uniref:solute carrier family 25 member 45-like n=1 Tax=Mercenaria mercenaria TaxID=6596 RepID=UPI00234E57D8|nr:solute carrier family 25 member 45-like [Mercenaria mercenaria]